MHKVYVVTKYEWNDLDVYCDHIKRLAINIAVIVGLMGLLILYLNQSSQHSFVLPLHITLSPSKLL